MLAIRKNFAPTITESTSETHRLTVPKLETGVSFSDIVETLLEPPSGLDLTPELREVW